MTENNRVQTGTSRVYNICIATGVPQALRRMEADMNHAINGAPSGDIRNRLTDINIARLQVLMELEEYMSEKEGHG